MHDKKVDVLQASADKLCARLWLAATQMKTAEEVTQMKKEAAEEKAEAVVITATLKRAIANEKNHADVLKEVARATA